MKNLTFVAVGLAGLAIATPSFAASGFAGGGFTTSETEVGDFESEADGWFVEGAAAFGAPQGLGFEVDAGYSDVDDFDSTSITGHLFQNGREWRLGGFVGLGDVEDEDVVSIGAEGLRYFSNFTLGAALGYAEADDVDALGVDGEARFFVSDNLRLDGRLGWTSVDTDFGDDDAFSIGVGAEYQFDAAPISVFGGYRLTDFDESDASVDTFRVGLRFNWSPSLKSRDREGPAFTGLSSLSSAIGSL